MIISCLISTLPQFFLSHVYSDITGQLATTKSFYLFTLSAFTHSPDMLVKHLIGNVLVFIVFGTVVEIIIGSKRFALISMMTFLSTTFISYLHTIGNYSGHGASGIAWGYHIFFIYFLIIIFRHKGKEIFKDGYIILALLLLVFDIFGIPILEVVALNKGFFENFGQVLHLISMATVIPFIFLWRSDIESNIKKLTSKEEIVNPVNNKNFAITAIIILVLLNGFGTYKAINLTVASDYDLSYSIVPELGTSISNIPKIITVKFNEKIQDSIRTTTSISYDENLGKIQLKEEWQNPKTLLIEFNREFIDEEEIKLVYLISREIDDGILIRNKLVLEYTGYDNYDEK